MLKAAYRNTAKLALARAKENLNSNESANLRYAALELRMALECLVYERAQNYKDELPSKKLNTWQPRQLLSILLDINPYADKTSTISVGIEEEYGVQAKVMTLLGTDRVISLKEIKEFYDRLGSYLHTPTIDQTEQGKGIPGERLRSSCEKLIEIIESSLNSTVKNVDFKTTVTISCEECGTNIIRRVVGSEDKFQATCIECSATYTISKTDNSQYKWSPNIQRVACANPECNEIATLWQKDIILHNRWTCTGCNGLNTFGLGVFFSPNDSI